MARAQVVLVVPDIRARRAQRRHQRLTEGAILVAVADKDWQSGGHGAASSNVSGEHERKQAKRGEASDA